MICLSKADEGTFRHLEYNQSPRPLAAEHTTRQDLNGISNLREHVAAGQDGDGGCNGGGGGAADMDEKRRHGGQPPGPRTEPLKDAGRWAKMPSSCLSAAERSRLSALKAIPLPSLSALWSWASWLGSVVAVSLMLNYLTSARSDDPVHRDATDAIDATDHAASPVRLLRRRSTCASSDIEGDEYNTALHAGSVVIIWFVSTLACGFPMLARKLPGLRIPQRFFFVVRHFGTGVLIATAFVHLLPTAFISLGDPCLSPFWTDDYPAMPGAIALAAIFFVTVIEMVFHPARKCTSMPSDVTDAAPAEKSSDARGHTGAFQTAETHGGPASDGAVLALPMRDMQPPRRRSGSMVHSLNRLNVIEASDDEAENRRRNDASHSKTSTEEEAVVDDLEIAPTQSDGPGNSLSPEQKLRKERLQCVLLELGILFHSVFIGMALAVSVGNTFVILLIAIVFHRTYLLLVLYPE